jgi:hypothetical protein
MTALLLDHPWRLEESLDPSSDAFRVLEQFQALVREREFEVVRFVSQTDYDEMWQRIDYSNARTRAYALLCSFAQHLVLGNDAATAPATPDPEPEMLSESWKLGLRQAMENLQDWRNPQIIVSEKRRSVWPNSPEVGIRVEDASEAGLQYRVLANLESYGSHPFASTDLDPFDLSRFHPPIPGVDRQHPSILPRPPALWGVPFEGLTGRLGEARSAGWRISGRYYFVPPIHWRAEEIDKPTWRNGRAFPYDRLPEHENPGPIDYEGRVWVWHETERHWDVQGAGEYFRVSHTGEEL